MIIGSFCTYCQIHFFSGNALFFFDICPFVNLAPKLRSRDGCDMRKCTRLNHSKCKIVLNLLEVIYSILGNIVVRGVIVVKFGVDSEGNDGY